MKKHSNRRTFLAALCSTGAVSLAGCSSLPGQNGSSTPTSTQTARGSPTSSGTNDTTTSTDTGQGNETRGTLIDDFQGDVRSRWGVSNGTYTITNKDVFQGSQSLVLEPKPNASRPVAKIFRAFYPKPLNLTTHDLSLAVKVTKPETVKIAAEIIAPDEQSMLTAIRHIPRELDGWVRFDIGYTDKTGTPALDTVSQVNIQIGPPTSGSDFQVVIDDLRTYPKPSTGKVMFQFDDAHISTYEEAYPILQEKGWPGAVAVIPDAINGTDRITGQMMTEMNTDGWDMIGHASKLLPQLPEQKQRRILRQTHQYLTLKGFEKGARHFVPPYSRVDAKTLSLIDEIFETGFLFGGCPNNAQHPSNPSFISRVQGPDVRGTRQILDVANEFNQLAVISYHALGEGENATPVNAFNRIVDHVEQTDLEVITPSQLIDSKHW